MKFKMIKPYKESYRTSWLEIGKIYADSQLEGGIEKAKSLCASGYARLIEDNAKTAPLQPNARFVEKIRENEKLVQNSTELAEAVAKTITRTKKTTPAESMLANG